MRTRQCFRVWAPFASKVELQLGKRRISMRRVVSNSNRVGQKKEAVRADMGGWWMIEAQAPESAVDYGFVLDGEGPFPDPRSPWQPNGVHRLSRLVDHGTFEWADDGWNAPPLSSAIFYELHIGTFTPEGTFDAAVGKLDYLASLGITHVELMPVNEFAGDRGWGYDGVGLFAPHHAYGGPDGLKRFVQACHQRGLAAILDVVYNHLGPAGNYLGRFGPYFTTRYSTPWGPALNFDDRDSDPVRRFFCDNAVMWLRDYHFDGLRLDAVHAILDTSAVPFLEQLKLEVAELEEHLGRRLVLIAESDLNDPRVLWPRERGGLNLDAQWSDDFHHGLHSMLTGETAGYYADFGKLSDLAKAIRQVFIYDGRYSRFRKRRHGRSPEGLSGDRFIVCLQNHDQIGNRVRGERIHQLLGRSNRRKEALAPETERFEPPHVACYELGDQELGLLKIGTALLLTAPFSPLLFQGQEWGASSPFLYFTDHDKKLGKAIRESRRQESVAFGWKPEEVPDPQAPETFRASRLKWCELSLAPHAEILKWHRQLIHLRKTEPALTEGHPGSTAVQFDDRAKWLVVERGPLTVACNFDSRPRAVGLREGEHRLLLASIAGVEVNSRVLKLPPTSVAILNATA